MSHTLHVLMDAEIPFHRKHRLVGSGIDLIFGNPGGFHHAADHQQYRTRKRDNAVLPHQIEIRMVSQNRCQQDAREGAAEMRLPGNAGKEVDRKVDEGCGKKRSSHPGIPKAAAHVHEKDIGGKQAVNSAGETDAHAIAAADEQKHAAADHGEKQECKIFYGAVNLLER